MYKNPKRMSNFERFSKRALGLKPSLTLEISSLAQSLRKSGKDIIPNYFEPFSKSNIEIKYAFKAKSTRAN